MVKEHSRLLILLAVGAVVGSVVNSLLAAAHAPEWLVRVLPMGFDPPFSINLVVCELTFGFTLSLSFFSILGMILALVLYRKQL